MKWFLNLKNSKQNVCMLIVAVFFMAFIGWVGYINLEKANVSMRSMYNDRLSPIQCLNEGRAQIRENEANLLWLILAKDKSQQEKIWKILKYVLKNLTIILKFMKKAS